MREGPFADFTINYNILQKSIISEAMERREKTTAKSRKEDALCTSFSLIAFFFVSLYDATSDQGSPNVGSVYLYRFLLCTVNLAHWSQAVQRERLRRRQGQSVYMTAAWNTPREPVTYSE